MSSHGRKRFFVNNLPDYSGSVSIDSTYIKKQLNQCMEVIKSSQGTRYLDCDGGLYVGTGGIGYMFLKLSRNHKLEDKETYLKEGLVYLNSAIQRIKTPRISQDTNLKSAFLLGNAGIHAVAASYFKELGNTTDSSNHLEQFIESAENCYPVNFMKDGGDELLVGRAGYLSGCLWLQKELGQDIIPDDILSKICNVIVESGYSYAKKTKSPSPLMYQYHGEEYLGAAHGLSSILQMLLSCSKWLAEHPEVESDIHLAVDYLLTTKLSDGNYPPSTSEINSPRPEENELVHWCHGAPGIIYLFAKAYLIWKDPKYLQACEECGELIWNKGLLLKGPGICHGIAGNGYAFLLLYRLTKNDKHLHRAMQFAHFLSSKAFDKARTPDSPFSLYEGLAGTVCFLADLLEPSEASFPFFDIFK